MRRLRLSKHKHCRIRSGGVIAAGMVCTSESCGVFEMPGESNLARISFPIQEYTEGFCPCEAFEQGTMFPELVL